MPSPSLPTHLEQLVRRQIATGRYHSADEVIAAALRLLEALPAGRPAGPEAAVPGWTRRRAPPAVGDHWETPAEWRAAAPAAGPAPPRRSPRGLLADLRSGITFDDVRDARGELWAGLRPGEL